MSNTTVLEDIKALAKKVVGIDKEEITELATEVVKDEVKADEVIEVNFAQETLENGTVLEADEFASGNPVFIVNEEERVPLPVGEYSLANGQILVVTEEGVIAEFKPKAEEAPAEEVEASTDFITREEFNKAMEDLKSLFSTEKEKLSSEKEDLEKTNVELKAQLDEEPAAELIKHSPIEQKEVILTTSKEKITYALRNAQKN